MTARALITTPALIAALDVLTAAETDAGRVLLAMCQNGNHTLTEEQQRVFHRIADDYGTRALTYVNDHNGGRDGSTTAPGMVLIQTAVHAAQTWADHGLPNEHIADHSLWAVSRAAVAALTWVHVELGHIEAFHRMAKATTAARRPR